MKDPNTTKAERAQDETQAPPVAPVTEDAAPAGATAEDPEGDGLKNDGKATTAETPGDILSI